MNRIGNTRLHASIGATPSSPRPSGVAAGGPRQSLGSWLGTVARIEQGKGVVQGNFSTIVKIQQALERAGIISSTKQLADRGPAQQDRYGHLGSTSGHQRYIMSMMHENYANAGRYVPL